MRQLSSAELQRCVWDFLESIGVLPRWMESSTSDKPGRGHYEWGNWSDTMRQKSMWLMGGPWRTLVADIRTADLILSVASFHKVKDQVVWEIVEQTYLRSERRRQSAAPEDIVKTRIRSVFSWQRRHDVRKHSLIWFLDLAFVLSSYCEFQARMLFSGSPIPNTDPANFVPSLAPSDFGIQSVRMEDEMISHGFVPFYLTVGGLADSQVLLAHQMAFKFCVGLNPPIVDMDMAVRETRGMPREDKAVDFMTPWLQRMEGAAHRERWDNLVRGIYHRHASIRNLDIFKTEVCRCIVTRLLFAVTRLENAENGYVFDIVSSTAVEHGEKELLVSLRLGGLKRKRTVSRRTLRSYLDEHFCKLERNGFRVPSASSGGARLAAHGR